MADLTQERLHKALDYDPGTGVFTRRQTTTPNPRAREGMRAGSQWHGYIGIRVGKTKYLAHRLAWFYVYGQWPDDELDHINGIKDDNRIANLRRATRSQNMANAPRQRNNRSGAKGVHYDKLNSKWMAYAQVNGRFRNLGRFASKDDAIRAREHAAREFFGEFARM